MRLSTNILICVSETTEDRINGITQSIEWSLTTHFDKFWAPFPNFEMTETTQMKLMKRLSHSRYSPADDNLSQSPKQTV